MEDFAAYARDHSRHPHCASCSGCLLNPEFAPIEEANIYKGFPFYPLWCAGCTCRIKKALPPGAKPIWQYEFVTCE